MADTISKQILVDVQLKADDLKKDLPVLSGAIDKLTQAQKDLEKQGQKNSQQYVENATQLRQLKAEVRDTNRYIDNVSKAINSENNSIQQNRALLSTLTQDYVNLGKPLEQDTQKVKALSDTLKQQEKAIGQSNREVGNYAENILNATKQMTGFVPGGNQVTSVLNSLGKGFNVMGGSAEGATGATAGLSAGMTGLVAAGVAVVAILASVAKWFADLTPHAEFLQRQFSGLKAVFSEYMSDMGKGTGFFTLMTDMKNAYNEAVELKQAMQDLDRQTVVTAVHNAEADAKIADLQLKMKNRRNTPQQEQAYFDQIQKIANKSYDERKKLADKEYDVAVRAAINGRKFMKDGVDVTQQELEKLKKLGADYAAVLDKTYGLRNADDKENDVRKIAKAQEAQIAAERYKQTIADRAQNRLDMVEDRAARKKEEAQRKAEEAANKELKLEQDIVKATEDANNARAASVQRMLELQMSAFAKELAQTDEHYRQLIFKQQEFINKYEHMNAAMQKRYKGAYEATQKAIQQLEKEHFQARLKQITDFNKSMNEKVLAANNELAAIRISNIENDEQRTLAQLDQQQQTELSALKKKNDAVEEEIRKYQSDIAATEKLYKNAKTKAEKDAYAEEINALKQQLGQEYDILSDYEDEGLQIVKKFEKAKADEIKKAAQARLLAQDEADVINSSRGVSAFHGDEQEKEAQKKQLTDKYNIEKQAAIDRGESTVAIEARYQQQILNVQMTFAQRRLELEKKIAKEISGAAFSIIKTGIQNQEQAQTATLERQKAAALNNSNLTATQRAAVEERYRKLELQAKQKAFREQQRASVAEALINGALAMTKVAAQTGVLSFAFDPVIAAETAVAVAAILAQKPPAYAKGGVHYTSDQKGTLLSGPGSGTSDSMLARVSNGEAIINARSTSAFAPILSAINMWGGGRSFYGQGMQTSFATGGVAGYTPTIANNLRANGSPIMDYNLMGHIVSNAVTQAVSKMPAPVVDVKDINRAQSGLATVSDRGSW